MKKVYVIYCIVTVLFCLLPLITYAQAPDTSWAHIIDRNDRDVGFSLDTNEEGEIIIAGYSRNISEQDDGLIIKLDLEGNIIWESTISGSDERCIYDIKVSSDGGLIGTGDINTETNNRRIWVFKTNDLGVLQWEYDFSDGEANWSFGEAILEKNGGSIVVVGRDTENGTERTRFLELDSLGNLTNSVLFGAMDENYIPFDMIHTNDGGTIVLATYRNDETNDLLLIKFNSENSHEWTHNVDAENDELGFSIVQTPENNFVILSSVRIDNFQYGYWLKEVNSAGFIIWEQCLGNEFNSNPNSLISCDNGYYIATTNVISNSPDIFQGLIIKTDFQGDSLWSSYYPSTPSDTDGFRYSAAEMTIDGGLVATGRMAHNGDQSDVLVVKYTNEPSRSFDLIYPANEDSVDIESPLDVELIWAESEDPFQQDPLFYDLQVQVITSRMDSTLFIEDLSDTTYTLSLEDDFGLVEIENTITINWHVDARTGVTTTTCNDDFTFLLFTPQSPSEFHQIAPENNTLCFDRNPTLFSWSRPYDNDPGDLLTFTLEWSLDESFDDFNAQTFTDTIGQVLDIPNNTDIYWRVRVVDSFDNEVLCDDYSNPWHARINAPEEIFNVETGGDVVSGFTILEENILYIPSSSNVVRLDSQGNIEYTLQTSDDVLASTTITSDHTVYIASTDNFLYSFNSNGVSNPGWPFALGSASTASVTIDAEGVAYIGTENGIYQAISPDGNVVWSKNLGGTINSASIISINHILYIINENGRLYAFDLENIDTENVQENWRLELEHPVSSSPALNIDNNINITTEDGFFLQVADNGSSGSITLNVNVECSVLSSPVIDVEQNVYFSSYEGDVFRIDGHDGNVVWEKNVGANIGSEPVLSPYSMLYAGDSTGYLHCLSTLDGRILWSKLCEGEIVGPLLWDDCKIYYGAGSNAVALLEPQIQPDPGTCAMNLDETYWWPTFQGNNRRTGYHGDTPAQSEETNIINQPTEFAISATYPNPFNPTLTAVISLPHSSDLTVQVFNLMGQHVATIAEGHYQDGFHSFTFDGTGMASGVYFIIANSPGNLNQVKKVVLMK